MSSIIVEGTAVIAIATLTANQVTEAIAGFEKYLQLAPEGQFAAQAKAMLAQLKK